MSSNGRPCVWLRALVASVAIAYVLIASMFGYLFYLRWRFTANVQRVCVGDTKEQVEQLLGPPRHRFAKGGQLSDGLRKGHLLLWLFLPESPETWTYGHWKFIELTPGDDDYAVEFDDAGCVKRVIRPGEHRKPGSLQR